MSLISMSIKEGKIVVYFLILGISLLSVDIY